MIFEKTMGIKLKKNHILYFKEQGLARKVMSIISIDKTGGCRY